MRTGAGGRSGGALAVVAGLTMLALALRLPSMADSLYGDEISTSFVVHGFGVDGLLPIVAGDQENTPPLFYVLTDLTKELGGVEGLRLVSLAAGLALVPLTYLLGERTLGRDAALVGAAIVAISPFLVFYSTEARAYALVGVLVLVSALALLRATETGRWAWWALYALAAAGALYTHNTAVFSLAAVFAWAFVARPGARKGLLLATATAALLYAPWLPELQKDRGNPAARLIDAGSPLSWEVLRTDLNRWALGHPFEPPDEMPGSGAQWLVWMGVGLGLIAGSWQAWRRGALRSIRPSSGPVLVAVMAVATPAGLLLFSLLDYSIITPRNLIASSPALALLLGAGATAAPRGLRVATVTMVLAGFAIGAAQVLDGSNHRPQATAAVDYVRTEGGRNPVLIEFPSSTPGPQSQLEAAAAPLGRARPSGVRIFAVDTPVLSERLRAAGPGEPNILALELPRPTAQQAAARAAREASGGPLFVVWSESLPRSLEELMGALPPGYKLVESRQFEGYGDPYLFVYKLERRQEPDR